MTNKQNIFENEFLPHADALANFAYYLTKDDTQADDLLQDTFERAIKNTHLYQEGTNPKAWLFRMMRNLFINSYHTKKRRGKEVELEDYVTYHDEDDSSPLSTMPDLRTEIFSESMGDEVTNAISNLPSEMRSILILCYIEGFHYDELAEIFEIPIGTVRSRLARAREKLSRELNTYAQSLGYDTQDDKN